MEEIAAAPGQLIELNDDRWRLFQVNSFERLPVLEVQRKGAVLFYRQDFGRKHGLPPGNWITGEQVAQVVVGWAPDQRCWLLGLQLRGAEGDRWCELVRFPPAPRDQHSTSAQRAARALAEALSAPLRVIRDPVVTTPVPPPTPNADAPPPVSPSALLRPASPPPPMPPAQIAYDLPIVLGPKVLRQTPAGLRLEYAGRWVRNQCLQVVFNLLLAALFGFISTRSLVTPYAPVHEPWLPFAGLLVMVALAVMSVFLAIRLMRAVDVVFDRTRGAIYSVLTLGRWVRFLRRQARAPMPLRAVKAMVARNIGGGSARGDWLVFAQTADDAVVFAENAEKPPEGGGPPQAVQAAAAIANLLNVPLRIMEESGQA